MIKSEWLVLHHTYDSQNQFMDILQRYQSDLARYCRMLTGTPWDAEDLLQEALIKVYQSSVSINEHPAPKAYLFRTATNAWIDHCRKNKVPLDTYEDERIMVRPHNIDFEVRETLEELLCHLPPRQVAILLLTDVFGFTAGQAASMMDMTEGSVKAALHRARTNVKQIKEQEVRAQSRMKSKSVSELVDIFLKAFKKHDPVAISRAYHSLKHHGVEVQRVTGSGMVSFQFSDPDGNVFTVTAKA